MSGIDWSKAPEEAQYLGDFGDWYKLNEGRNLMVWFPKAGIWNESQYSKVANHWVSRPVSWNGEGLPPVGLRCEAAIPHTSGPDNERSFIWVEGSVIAYYEIKGKAYAWFAEDDGFYPPNVLEFRPVRTPEQIAADERSDAIKQMVLAIMQNTSGISRGEARCCSNALHDAGYRKP
jgi:hypothetical protein